MTKLNLQYVDEQPAYSHYYDLDFIEIRWLSSLYVFLTKKKKKKYV